MYLRIYDLAGTRNSSSALKMYASKTHDWSSDKGRRCRTLIVLSQPSLSETDAENIEAYKFAFNHQPN